MNPYLAKWSIGEVRGLTWVPLVVIGPLLYDADDYCRASSTRGVLPLRSPPWADVDTTDLSL